MTAARTLTFPGALVIFVLGIGYGIFIHGLPPVQPGIPIDVYIPSFGEILSGIYKAGIAQVPLTLTNAVLATSLLASDLFREKVSNKKLSLSIGVANLLATPLGGLPMCHGSGGMAAHYKFGARTGGAPIMMGIIFVLLSFISTNPMLDLIPYGILGTLLLFAGAELLKNSLKTDILVITVAMGIVTLAVDPTIGLVVGIILYILYLIFVRLKR